MRMSRCLVLGLVLVASFFVETSYALSQQNVLYGERPDSLNHPSVFFDREGNLYPDYYISDSSLQAASASLSQWYLKHNDAFEAIARSYNCSMQIANHENIRILQDSIRNRKIASLNAHHDAMTLNILIHGFRKSFYENGKDVTSVKDFGLLEEDLKKKGG